MRLNESMTSLVELIDSLTKGDGMADPFEERVDVAIRFGNINGSTMIARSLSPFRQFVCASADYLSANGATASGHMPWWENQEVCHRLRGSARDT
jgi:DNA-binding transcriptional LysR family regulator